jgi:hypothetical protein
MRLNNSLPLVVVILDPQAVCLLVKSPPAMNLGPRVLKKVSYCSFWDYIWGGGGSTPQKLSSGRKMYEHKWKWLEEGQVHIAIIRSAELFVSLVWLCPRPQCRRGDWCNKCCIAVFESESSWWSGFRLRVGCRSCCVVRRDEFHPCAGQPQCVKTD